MAYDNNTSISINARGKTPSDVLTTLDDAVELAKQALNRGQGNYSDRNENETGAFDFEMTSSSQFPEAQ